MSPTATHAQIMLLRRLEKGNYQLPLLITDAGVPPLFNNSEVKVQVCVCKNRMLCSSAHSHRSSLLVLLAALLLALLCKYHHPPTENFL